MLNLASIKGRLPAQKGVLSCRKLTTASHNAASVWQMPWQQCSIFSRKSGLNAQTVSNDGYGGEPTDLESDETLSKADQRKERLHDALLGDTLPKWNAPLYVKALQNAAYLKSRNAQEIDNVEHLVKRLVKTIAINVNGLNNYELTRVIFACAKGGLLSNKIVTQSFITLMEDEIMQRMDALQAMDLFRIFHSITHINATATMYPVEPIYKGHIKTTPFEESVVKRIVYRIIDRIANLGVMDIANLHCLIAYNGMVDDKIVKGMNKAIKRRLWGIKDTMKILTPAVAMGMFGALQHGTTDHVIKALRSGGTLPQYDTGIPTTSDSVHTVNIVNNQLFPLKLLEAIIRLDYQEIYHKMGTENKTYLSRIRNIMPRLYRCSDWEFVPPPPTAKHNSQHCAQDARLDVVPHIHGPYVIRACDPVRSLIVEGQNEWDSIQTWQRFYIHKYYQMRNRHLSKAGFTFIQAT